MHYLRTYLLAFLVLLVLSGCANTAARRTSAGLDLDLVTKDSEGFVVLKVIATQPISLLNPKWQSIKISSDSQSDEMMDITPTYNMLMGRFVPTESLYFAKLKAGEYEVTGMGSIGPGPGLLLALMMADNSGSNHKLPRFTVRAGQLANLGTIVYVPEIGAEQRERLFLLDGPSGKRAAYQTLISEAKRTDVPLLEGGGWNSKVTAEAEANVLANARQHVILQGIWKREGELLGGSHLGVLLRRTGPQSWNHEAIDTLSRVNSVARASDGRLLVGSDYGSYFVKEAKGEWREHRLPLETGRIVHIEPRADGSALVVTAELQETRIWLLPSVDGGEAPHQIAHLKQPPDPMLVTRKELILAGNIPGFSRETVLTRIDKQTLAVTTENEKFWLIDWSLLPDGTVAATRMNGLSLLSSRWLNDLHEWVLSEDRASISTWWLDAQNALSVEPSPGFKMVGNQLRSTRDGGKTWTAQGIPVETEHFAASIVFADKDEVLLQGRNFVYSTLDRGQTWRRVFPAPDPK